MSSRVEADIRWMSRAIELAKRGFYSTTPNPNVGCVLVKDGELVAEGWHERAGEHHAEAMALAVAGIRAKGCTAYVSLEPCSFVGRTPACSQSLINAGVRRVVCAMQDPHDKVSGQGFAQLRAAGVEVECGLLQADAEALNPGYCKRQRTGLPWLSCKLAMSLDGRTAMADGTSQWITSPAARHDVQQMRARSCAVITGINTIVADDARLNVRYDELNDERLNVARGRQPLRVVMDSNGRCPDTAAVLEAPGEVLLVTAEQAQLSAALRARPNVEVQRSKQARPQPEEVLRELARRGCNNVLLECGSVLAGAFATAGMIDEFIIYAAPKLMGSLARPLLQLELLAMSESIALNIIELDRIGPDLKIVARVI